MPALDQGIRTLTALIEFGGSLIIVFGCLRGLRRLMAGLGGRDSLAAAHRTVADGIVAGLGFKMAATLLKTMELRDWNAILMFLAVLALRTIVARVGAAR